MTNCNLKQFEKRLKKRLNNGIGYVLAELEAQLKAELSAKRGFKQGGVYYGSKPNQSPALFEAWFTENLTVRYDEEELQGFMGFSHAHAAQIYRLLIQGTDEIEPRRGVHNLYDDIKPDLIDAFNKGLCQDVQGPLDTPEVDDF